MDNKFVVILILIIISGTAMGINTFGDDITITGYFKGKINASYVQNLNESININLSNATNTLANTRLSVDVVLNNQNTNFNNNTLSNVNLTGKVISNVIYAENFSSNQDALNMCGTSGCEVVLKSEVIVSTLTLPQNNMTVRGRGIGLTVITVSGNIDGIAATGKSNITIKELSLIGGTQNGISLESVNFSKIYNVDICCSALKGISFVSGEKNSVYNNVIHNNGQEGIVVSADVVKNLSIDDYDFYNNRLIANGAYGGLGTVTQSSSVRIQNIRFHDNFLDNPTATNAVDLRGCFNCSIYSNYIRGGTQSSIQLGLVGTVQQQSNFTNVFNNIIFQRSYGYAGIRIQAGYNNTVINNMIIDGSYPVFENGYDNNMFINNIGINTTDTDTTFGTNTLYSYSNLSGFYPGTNIVLPVGKRLTAGSNTLNIGEAGITEPQTIQLFYRNWKGADNVNLKTGSTNGILSLITQDSGSVEVNRVQITGGVGIAQAKVIKTNLTDEYSNAYLTNATIICGSGITCTKNSNGSISISVP